MPGSVTVPEVITNFKENQGPCECGTPNCIAYGTLKKPWKSNGKRCVRASCWCAQCRGSKNKKGGQRDQQGRGAKRIAGVRGKREEQWDTSWTFRWENKRDGRYAKPIFECYSRSFALALATGPLVVEATGKLKPYSLYIFRDDQIKEFCEGTYELAQGIHTPVHTSFSAMERINEQQRPIGDNRPFLFRAAQPRMRFGLVVCRADKLSEVRTALRLQHGWSPDVAQ